MDTTPPQQQATNGPATGPQPMGPEIQEQVDQLVRRRLEQAFGSVVRKVLTATERATNAAESQAQANRLDGLTKGLKLDVWKPGSREEELRGWKDWFFQLRTWLSSHDPKYEEDIKAIKVDEPQDHALMDSEATNRSQKLFGVLCSYVRGRPLLLVKSQDDTKNGMEAVRILQKEMEPKERSRALAIVRNLAAWTFREGNLHEQLVAYEEAVTAYERASDKKYPQDLMIATLVTGLKEPLRSQVQLRMNDKTEYKDLQEWVLSYESVNAPWSVSLPAGAGKGQQGLGGGSEAVPMEVDQIKGKKGKKGKDSKGAKGKDAKGGKKGKGGGKGGKHGDKGQWRQDGKGKASQGWQQQQPSSSWQSGGKSQMPGICHNCGGKGHWKNECCAGDPGGWNVPERRQAAEVLQIWADSTTTEIVVDSGADVSVAPLAYHRAGREAPATRIVMQDAQGRRIEERGVRILNLTVRTLENETITLKERFAIAAVNLVILSLGKLVRAGWTFPQCHRPSDSKRWLHHSRRAAAKYLGEEAVESPGWHILPSGLPFFVGHRAQEISLETSVWSTEDWGWLAIFVRKEEARRKPAHGDVWVQVWTGSSENFPENGRRGGAGWPEGLCSSFPCRRNSRQCAEPARRPLSRSAGEDVAMAMAHPGQEGDEDDGGGVGDVLEGRPVRGQEVEPEPEDLTLDNVALDMQTPLADLRELCKKLSLPSSGPKPKVLSRLKKHRELVEKQLATDVAHSLFKEQERQPSMMKVPVLPTPQQQEAHFITHQPFASWCPACVLARSRQSPHSQQREAKAEKEGDKKLTTMQIDYAYTFTGDRGIANEEDTEKDAEKDAKKDTEKDAEKDAEKEDKANQFALNLVAGEVVTGWLVGMPVLAKGAASLKKVTKNLVRVSMLFGGAEDSVVQGDTEPAIGQILNAVQACRAKLGLRTVVRQVPRDSQSNGVAEKAVSTLRRLALTLKAHLEERTKIKISGVNPGFSSTPRRLVPFGEQRIGYVKPKFKGDLQWRPALLPDTATLEELARAAGVADRLLEPWLRLLRVKDHVLLAVRVRPIVIHQVLASWSKGFLWGLLLLTDGRLVVLERPGILLKRFVFFRGAVSWSAGTGDRPGAKQHAPEQLEQTSMHAERHGEQANDDERPGPVEVGKATQEPGQGQARQTQVGAVIETKTRGRAATGRGRQKTPQHLTGDLRVAGGSSPDYRTDLQKEPQERHANAPQHQKDPPRKAQQTAMAKKSGQSPDTMH
ncbi:unnamed protein product [Symbiodinium sp. CCMP2592]|nr:unnamed protein product [Symbiodinium sp. CCMP2592]